MRTPEEKILRAVGEIKNEKLITATMPKHRRSLFGTERRRLTYVTVDREPVSRMYYVKRAVIGIAAAALVITGAVMLWRYIRYDYVDPDQSDFRSGAYSDYEALPVLPENGEDDGTGRDNVLLLTTVSGDGDADLKYRVELLADNVFQMSADDPYMLVCDPYAVVTDINTGEEIGTMYFFPGDPLPIMPAKGVKYDSGGMGMDWLRADVGFMYADSGTCPLFSTQYATEKGGMYTTFYGINSDGELQIFTNFSIDKSILSEGTTVGMELSGTNTVKDNYYIDIKRNVTFEFDFDNIFIYAYKGTTPPEKSEEPHDPVAGPSELHENSTAKALPVQEKFLSDREPGAGEGDAFGLDMLVCANGTVYQYISYGRFSYDTTLKQSRDFSYSREDTITELIDGIKAVSDRNGVLQEEYLSLLQKADDVRGYFTNEPITTTDFYYIGDNYMISVGSDGWGNGVRFMQRLDGKSAWSTRTLRMRKTLELLWTVAAEQPDIYGDMSIVFVTSMMSGHDVEYSLEAIVRDHTDELREYLAAYGADMEQISVLTPEQERAAYMPVGNIHIDENGKESSSNSYNQYGRSYLNWEGRGYVSRMAHVTENVYKFAELNSLDDLKKALDDTPVEELPVITPREHLFDMVEMPWDTQGHIFRAVGTSYIIEQLNTPDGEPVAFVVYEYNVQLTEVIKEVQFFRQTPKYYDGDGSYDITRLDFVSDSSGDKERLYLRISAPFWQHDFIEKCLQRGYRFGTYYFEITS